MNPLWPDEPLTPFHKYAVSTETVNNRSACPWVMRTNKVHVASLIVHIYLYKGFITIHTAERKRQEDCISYVYPSSAGSWGRSESAHRRLYFL